VHDQDTRHVDRSMKNRTMNRSKPFEVHTSIMKKSDAAMSCQKFSPGWLNAVLENLDRFVRQHVPRFASAMGSGGSPNQILFSHLKD
jgi:inhibitor of KinA sporulation pathway (predicted exonuclease)